MEFDDDGNVLYSLYEHRFKELMEEVQEETKEELETENYRAKRETTFLFVTGVLVLGSLYFLKRDAAIYFLLGYILAYITSRFEHLDRVNKILRNRDKKELLIHIQDSTNQIRGGENYGKVIKKWP